MLCPWEGESRCEGYRARSCTFLLCWNGCLRHGPSRQLSLTLGDLAKVKPEFSLPSAGNAGFTCYSASFATKCRSHFSCSIQADLRVEVLKREKRCTEASFWNTENPRRLPRPKYSVTLEDILEELSHCPLPETRTSSSGSCVSILSRGASELKRVTKYQLHFVVYGKYLASFPWMCAVVAEINTSVHKLLL